MFNKMEKLHKHNLWKDSDFFGKASFILRQSAYLFYGVFVYIFLDVTNRESSLIHHLTLLVFTFIPHLLFLIYVRSGNDKILAINLNMVDFFVVGWFIGLIQLNFIPSFVFSLGLLSNYIASRGFSKLFAIAFLPLGYLMSAGINQSFIINWESYPIVTHLALIYGAIHFISTAYISFRFSQSLHSKNKLVEDQKAEILGQKEELQALNESLTSLNIHLEEKVLERTKELTEKKEKLAEYTFMNGHILRAPVATLMGLINLLNYTEHKEEKQEILDLLKQEVLLLNCTVNEIKLKLESDELIQEEVKEVEAIFSKINLSKTLING